MVKNEKDKNREKDAMVKLENAEKFIAITYNGELIWKGFSSMYEILGFIDFNIDKNTFKNSILSSMKEGNGV